MPQRQNKSAKPNSEDATFFSNLPQWLQFSLCSLLAGFILMLPLTYDGTVPEVAGDMRWSLIHFVSFFGLALLALGAMLTPRTAPYKIPLVAFAILVFALTIPLSLIDAYNPYRAAYFSAHWLSYIGIFFLFLTVNTPKFQRLILWLLLIPLAINCLIGITQYHDLRDHHLHHILNFWPQSGFLLDWIKTTFLQSAVPGATFANKNLAASYTVLLLPLVLYQLGTSSKNWQKLAASIILFLAVTFLIYSRSRASWIAAIAALILGGLFLLTSPTWRAYLRDTLNQKTTLSLLIIAVSAGFGVGNLPSSINSHGLNRAASEQFKTLGRFDSNEFGPRLAYNLNGLQIVQDHPINGVGLGNFHTVYPNYHDANYATPRHGYNVMARPQRAHNDVMQMVIEVGLIGGLLFGSLWFFAAYMTWQLGRARINTGHHAALPLALFTSITGLSINALADFPLQMPTAPALLFALLALLTTLYVRAYHDSMRPIPLLNRLSTRLQQALFMLLTLVFVAAAFIATQHNMARRASAQELKFAMQRMQASVIDATTVRHLNAAHALYPYNTRLLEYRAIAYHNFQGQPNIPAHVRRAATDKVLSIDPYAANHHINVAHDAMKQAEAARKLGDRNTFQRHIQAAQASLDTLQHIAPFSVFTHGVDGMLHYVQGHLSAALVAFKRAQAINPSFAIANQAIPVIEQRLQATQNN